MTATDKAIKIAIKGILTGGLTYGLATMLMPGVGKIYVAGIGNVDPALAMSIASGSAEVLAVSINEFVLDDATSQSWEDSLGNLLEPTMAALAIVPVAYFLMGDRILDIKTYGLMAGIGGVSSIGSDYLFNNFVLQMITKKATV